MLILRLSGSLDEVGDVEGHLLDLGVVELFNFTHHGDVLLGDEVDGHTLTTETTTTADTVDVVLLVGGEVIVDDERDLLHVDTTGQEVGGDEDAGGSRAELAHNDIALGLVHVTVHARDGEIARLELVGEEVHLSAGVAEDDRLGDGERLVQVAQRVELVLLLVDGDVELLDTFKGELVALNENADGVAHEALGDLEHVGGHGGREQHNLNAAREELEDVIDLVGETAREHLVSLIEHEHLEVLRAESAAVDHVLDTAGRADDNVSAALKLLHVLADAGATNAGVALNVHVVRKGNDDLLDLLGQLARGRKDKGLWSDNQRPHS